MIELAILSYNRPLQLSRIFHRLAGFRQPNFRITVFDDASPSRLEVQKVVFNAKPNIANLTLVQRPVNLGYDLNLIDAVTNSSAKYVILLSDDDFVSCQGLRAACDELSECAVDYGVFPYLFEDKLFRVGFFPPDSAHQIYDSILFSGLVFRPEFFRGYDLRFLRSCIYSQVYMAQIALTYGTFLKFKTPLVYVGSDGENFFGKSPSLEDSDLSSRGSAFADLRYQQRLLSVIRMVDIYVRPGAFEDFLGEYRLRFVGLLFRLRSETSGKGFRSIALKPTSDLGSKFLVLLFYFILVIPKYAALPIYRLGCGFKKSG